MFYVPLLKLSYNLKMKLIFQFTQNMSYVVPLK